MHAKVQITDLGLDMCEPLIENNTDNIIFWAMHQYEGDLITKRFYIYSSIEFIDFSKHVSEINIRD